MPIPLSFITSQVLRPPLPTSETEKTATPFWGDNAKGDGGYVPANPQPDNRSGTSPDCAWEAPLAAWSQWDTGKLGGLQMPGLVRWRVRKSHRVDKKMATGQSGSTSTALGFEPAEVDLTFQMWTKNHLQQYEKMVGFILSTLATGQSNPSVKNAKPDPNSTMAMDIQMPALNLVGIYSLYLLVIGVPEPASTPQMFQATFKFQEFSPIKTSESVKRIGASQPDLSKIGNSVDQNSANVPADPSGKAAP